MIKKNKLTTQFSKKDTVKRLIKQRRLSFNKLKLRG